MPCVVTVTHPLTSRGQYLFVSVWGEESVRTQYLSRSLVFCPVLPVPTFKICRALPVWHILIFLDFEQLKKRDQLQLKYTGWWHLQKICGCLATWGWLFVELCERDNVTSGWVKGSRRHRVSRNESECGNGIQIRFISMCNHFVIYIHKCIWTYILYILRR